MTKSNIFKAAHKLAKAWHAKCGGDYVVYFAKALSGTLQLDKKASEDRICQTINKLIKENGGSGLITYTVSVKVSHGQHKFSHEHKMNTAARNLAKGHYFGKSWVSNGVFKVWEHSTRKEEREY